MSGWTGHITEEQLKAWTLGRLSAEEEPMFLAHIGACDHCAELLARTLEEQDLVVEPPAYLQEEILEKSRQIEIRTARTIYQTSRQMRLFFYSLKVGFALAVSLFALFLLPADGRIESMQKIHFLEYTENKAAEKLRDGSDKINDLLETLADWPISIEW